MNVLILSNDLVFPSRATALGRSQGHTVQTAATPATLLALADSLDDQVLLILDLTTPGCDPAEIVSQLELRRLSPTVVAFAPHVKVELLAAARQAGCDEVLTQGQFDRKLNELMGK